MRKLFLGLAISIVIPCVSQEYKPLLDSYNEWQLTYCYSGCHTDMYFTDGDTLVAGKTYKILDGYHFISRTFLLREELDSRKVYLNLVQRSGDIEYLLYDFSLNVGDSIDIKNPVTPFPLDGGYYKVDSISNRPLVDGNEYRHFYLSPTLNNPISTTPATWIEGVGSLSLINAPGGYPDINGAGHLSCFFKNGELFYSNLDSIDGCEPLVLGIGNTKSSLNDVTVNTVIAQGNCQLQNAENVRFIYVFDLGGRKLMTVPANGEQQISFNFPKVSAGIYLLVAHSLTFEKKVFKVLVP